MTLLLFKKKKKEEGKLLRQLSICMCRSRAKQLLPVSAGRGQHLEVHRGNKGDVRPTVVDEGHPCPFQWAFLRFLQSFINVELNITGQ